MDIRKYKRLQQWGAIAQQLRNQQTLSTAEKLMLEILRDSGNNFAVVMRIVDYLSKIDEPVQTRNIAEAIGFGQETMTQALRAMKEGGFEFNF